jgi:hypothetical protein
MERKDYPPSEAIANVFQLTLSHNPEIAGFNPPGLWDNHHLLELDDTGYMDGLYR